MLKNLKKKNMMTTFLFKPCPFCGKIPEDDDEDAVHPSHGWLDIDSEIRVYKSVFEVPPEQWGYVVNCVEHHGGCGASISGDSKQEAIDKWNRRD